MHHSRRRMTSSLLEPSGTQNTSRADQRSRAAIWNTEHLSCRTHCSNHLKRRTHLVQTRDLVQPSGTQNTYRAEHIAQTIWNAEHISCRPEILCGPSGTQNTFCAGRVARTIWNAEHISCRPEISCRLSGTQNIFRAGRDAQTIWDAEHISFLFLFILVLFKVQTFPELSIPLPSGVCAHRPGKEEVP